jgi:hypothetical protein
MPRLILAFTGRKRCGKSTAAIHLSENFGYLRTSFAGPIKDMMRALHLTEAEINGHLKEIPCDLLEGNSPRHGMQTIGYEWGRKMIGDNLWINTWRRGIEKFPANPILVDDCRFHNEADAIKKLGGYIVRVVNPNSNSIASIDSHASEAYSETLPCDEIILNDGTIDEFLEKVEQVHKNLSWAYP